MGAGAAQVGRRNMERVSAPPFQVLEPPDHRNPDMRNWGAQYYSLSHNTAHSPNSSALHSPQAVPAPPISPSRNALPS